MAQEITTQRLLALMWKCFLKVFVPFFLSLILAILLIRNGYSSAAILLVSSVYVFLLYRNLRYVRLYRVRAAQ